MIPNQLPSGPRQRVEVVALRNRRVASVAATPRLPQPNDVTSAGNTELRRTQVATYRP